MTDLRISLIIPCLNEERYLRQCLDAVAAQTVMPYEVIVVDNGSTDATAAIAQSYPFVRLITEPVIGRLTAQNAGFRAARGTMLGRIDADTRLSPQWIERLTKEYQRRPADAYTGGGSFYDVPLGRVAGALQVLCYQYLQWPALRGFCLWGSNMAVRRDAWESVLPSCHARADIDEDIDLSLQLLKHGFTIRYAPHVRVAASLRRGNMNPIDTVTYLLSWPRDYWVNQRYGAAAYITMLTIGMSVCSVLVWALLQSWAKKD